MPHSSDFISTSKASRILGIAITSVQKLIDQGTLQSWRTSGGHRRVSRLSVDEYMSLTLTSAENITKPNNSFKIVAAFETDKIKTYFQKICSAQHSVFELQLAESITKALIQIGSQQPELMILELSMSLEEQARILASLEDFCSNSCSNAILITKNSALADATKSKSNNIEIITGKLSEQWIDGYLSGFKVNPNRALDNEFVGNRNHQDRTRLGYARNS